MEATNLRMLLLSIFHSWGQILAFHDDAETDGKNILEEQFRLPLPMVLPSRAGILLGFLTAGIVLEYAAASYPAAARMNLRSRWVVH